MSKQGPIILIEDDADDHDIFVHALRDLSVQNPLVWFRTCLEALPYLKETTESPFIILCDINLPKMNGIEFKRRVDDDPQLRKKSIPFMFYSTSADKRVVEEAYTDLTVQGFFEKGVDYSDIKTKIRLILDYWTVCKHPNCD